MDSTAPTAPSHTMPEALRQRLDAVDVRIAELTNENSKLANENSKLTDRLDVYDGAFRGLLCLTESVCDGSMAAVESLRRELEVFRLELAAYEVVSNTQGNHLAVVRKVLSNINNIIASMQGHALGCPIEVRDLDPLTKRDGGPTNTPEESGP